jgi:hypothetical protein
MIQSGWKTFALILSSLASVITATATLINETQRSQGTAKPKPFQNCEAHQVQAVIHDKDGWTNVRPHPKKSDLPEDKPIGRINTGEVFCVTEGQVEWLPVTMPNGVKGFMHYSRIAKLH